MGYAAAGHFLPEAALEQSTFENWHLLKVYGTRV
jgi:hypothetical protein